MKVFSCQFVEKQHAVVGQRNLAGMGVGPAADKGHRGNGVVRGAEGAAGHQLRTALEPPGHGMDFGGLQGLGEGERGHNGGYALGHH